jgi:hypothetical protein
MNWGKGIAITLALFMGFIIYLAVTLMSQNVDLESEDYYAREIAYEEEIQAMKNGQNGPEIKVEVQAEHVLVQLPDSVDYTDVLVLFQRPNNDKLDKQFELKGTRMLALDKTLFDKGTYQVEISYRSGGKPCLLKQKIDV